MSRHPRVFFAMALLSASLFAGQAFADRTLTDQLGRKVPLPDHVTRGVVFQSLYNYKYNDRVTQVQIGLVGNLRQLAQLFRRCHRQVKEAQIGRDHFKQHVGAALNGTTRRPRRLQ